MDRALALAMLGRGQVEPNPMVGAVVAQGDDVVGEGYHRRYGGPHAEVEALDAAGSRAAGGTLYVTLEPCCHHGKTPPCTDRVLASGVTRIVTAMLDPFPAVSGQGAALLRQAGRVVEVGCREQEARELNAPYLTLLQLGRPFVHAKWAMTLDGRVATATGESQWITGEAARRHGRHFRTLVDGIVVGRGTVAADDPLLTARLPDAPDARSPTRVILDTRARLPMSCQLVATAREVPVLLACSEEAPADARRRLADAGIEVIVLPTTSAGVDLVSLLMEFGHRRWTHLLVEGGPATLGSFLDAGLIDAARVYVATTVVGGKTARGPVEGTGLPRLSSALRGATVNRELLDRDLFLSVRFPHSRV